MWFGQRKCEKKKYENRQSERDAVRVHYVNIVQVRSKGKLTGMKLVGSWNIHVINVVSRIPRFLTEGKFLGSRDNLKSHYSSLLDSPVALWTFGLAGLSLSLSLLSPALFLFLLLLFYHRLPPLSTLCRCSEPRLMVKACRSLNECLRVCKLWWPLSRYSMCTCTRIVQKLCPHRYASCSADHSIFP